MKLIYTSIFLLIIWTCVFIVYANKNTNDNSNLYNLQDATIATESVTESTKEKVQDTITTSNKLVGYNNLIFVNEQTLQAAAGTKSVIFNSKGTKLYAMNLEGLSVFEFDQQSKSLSKSYLFKPTKGKGWDYQTKISTNSFQEKPVEACITNGDSILWVSLHNANGIVPIQLFQNAQMPNGTDSTNFKVIKVVQPNHSIYSVTVPLVKTGSTPKVIEAANNGKNLLVSNWHSKTISILKVQTNTYPYAQSVKDISVAAIPRGIVVDDSLQKSYIAIMGSNAIAVLNNITFTIDTYLPVLSNPRHLLQGNQHSLIVSFNSINKVAIINKDNGAIIDSISTNAQPRSMALSKNKQFLFVTCYNGNTIDVYNISDNKLKPIYSLPCKGKPVGIDLYENDNILEAWVCNYVDGNIKVFSFTKN